jgi:hypothetical protein
MARDLNMVRIALTGWKEGFVANRLVALLREVGYGLAEAHGMATSLVEGGRVSLAFESFGPAQQFAERARALGVETAVEKEAGVA